MNGRGERERMSVFMNGRGESMSVMNGRRETEHVSCHEWEREREREKACQLS